MREALLAAQAMGERDERINAVAAWREAPSIGLVNLWNRVNAATRQVSGEWTAQVEV